MTQIRWRMNSNEGGRRVLSREKRNGKKWVPDDNHPNAVSMELGDNRGMHKCGGTVRMIAGVEACARALQHRYCEKCGARA